MILHMSLKPGVFNIVFRGVEKSAADFNYSFSHYFSVPEEV